MNSVKITSTHLVALFLRGMGRERERGGEGGRERERGGREREREGG